MMPLLAVDETLISILLYAQLYEVRASRFIILRALINKNRPLLLSLL